MQAKTLQLLGLSTALLASFSAGCGDVSRTGRSPMQAVITVMEAASGAEPTEFGTILHSDVVTMVRTDIDGQEVRVPTIFSDMARVTLRLIPKDPGQPGIGVTPTSINDVTFTRYRVVYRRTDGRNTPGADVPYGFDSAVTFTACGCGDNVEAGFELVRHAAKGEAPLLGLVNSPVTLGTIAEVTFYGRDQAGNDVIVTGNIGIMFGNFGDPD